MMMSVDVLFIETSALDSNNVEKAFIKVIQDIFHNQIRDSHPEDQYTQQNENQNNGAESSSIRAS